MAAKRLSDTPDKRADVDLRCPTRITDPKSGATYTKDLLPDAVFGLEYRAPAGSRFRFFAVEADRATEPVISGNVRRKSFERQLLQYEAYVEGGGYRRHLNLTAPLLVLNVTTSAARLECYLKMTAMRFSTGNSYQLFQVSA